MHVRMHIAEQALINALLRERFNQYVSTWMNPSREYRGQCELDRLATLLNQGRERH